MEVDHALDRLAVTCPFSGPKLRAMVGEVHRDPIDELLSIFRRLHSVEAKWLIRLILKDLRPAEIPPVVILPQFHFLMPDLLKIRTNLIDALELLDCDIIRRVSDDTWPDLQHKIDDLEMEMERWVDNLPEDLAIQGHASLGASPRIRTELIIYYHSLQMILHRPCLCARSAEAESIESQEFNRRSARACVHGAMSMLALLPNDPTTKEIYQMLPWWSLLHFVAQASVVLLLELAIEAQHFEGEVHLLVQSVWKHGVIGSRRLDWVWYSIAVGIYFRQGWSRGRVCV